MEEIEAYTNSIYKTNEKYREGIQFLLDKGWNVRMIVADGKQGLGKLFPSIPFQHCQFHLFQTVTRYISKKPKLQAGKELRGILFDLKRTDEESFLYWIEKWHEKWKIFLNEKTENILTGEKTFTHERLRSAYRSIVRVQHSLFTAHTLSPPHFSDLTTNSLDGYFSHLKAKLAVHRGASKNTQVKLISVLIFS